MGRNRKYFTKKEKRDAQRRWQMEYYERNKEQIKKDARRRYKLKISEKANQLKSHRINSIINN